MSKGVICKVGRCCLLTVLTAGISLALIPSYGNGISGSRLENNEAFSSNSGVPRSLHPRIEYRLQEMLEARSSLKGTSQEQPVQIHVLLDGPLTEKTRLAIEELNGAVELERGEHLQVLLPLGRVSELATLPQVRYIRLPHRAEPRQEERSGGNEGVQVTSAHRLHQLGVTGQGVRVAILDRGFQGYRDLLGKELPQEVTVKNFNLGEGFEGTNHGTGVAEILYDMAPDVELVLVAAGTELEYMAALDWLRTQEIAIVSFSLGFDNLGPLDGSSPVSVAASRLFDEAGILFVTAAGNEQQNYWSSTFHDSDGDGAHEFSDDDEALNLALRAGDLVRVILNWDDWGEDPSRPRSDQDYDLYIFCPGTVRFSPNNACASSVGFQTGLLGHEPLEQVFFTAPTTGTYYIFIVRASLETGERLLRLFIGGSQGRAFPMEYQSTDSTLVLPGDGRGVFTVGAMDVVTQQLEPASSLGPTWDGRIKPDIIAPDGVTTAVLGTFFGTSAATPHAAGAAALLKSQDPSRSAQELRLLLQQSSTDRALRGKDNEYGSGTLALENFVANRRLSPFSGVWWSPAQNGHGFFFDVRNGTLVATWYTYDRAGNPFWLLSGGSMETSSHYSGTLYAFQGPVLKPSLNSLFDSGGSTVVSKGVGRLDIDFINSGEAAIQIQLNGDNLISSNTFNLQAQPFLGYPAAEQTPQVPYTSKHDGLWWNGQQNGHGFFINIQDTVLTAAWYVYDDREGEPFWVLTAGPMSSATTYSGTAYYFLGPALPSGTDIANNFDAVGSTINGVASGNLSISFTSDTTATVAIRDVLSVNETLQLERFDF
ncbi:peptidase S8 and S53 subtilisin kexin sedolisin [Nitrosococcus halophilus Nc 4]|uniref:Peptidase S8 and S53 subtilisin kexin sedolisin n=1 Tax=Nitrosococcus halophilus (strain Nc4) TaxID=472759 RepID=D5C258_NITHN|nr:S8 family serine peptidase [Nitrosococcus halophilus]ADE16646.1 peptidase S8 and S53 subtilisin kexin sedolisin [Nitrosococcus halophilus Nc 4]